MSKTDLCSPSVLSLIVFVSLIPAPDWWHRYPLNHGALNLPLPPFCSYITALIQNFLLPVLFTVLLTIFPDYNLSPALDLPLHCGLCDFFFFFPITHIWSLYLLLGFTSSFVWYSVLAKGKTCLSSPGLSSLLLSISFICHYFPLGHLYFLPSS